MGKASQAINLPVIQELGEEIRSLCCLGFLLSAVEDVTALALLQESNENIFQPFPLALFLRMDDKNRDKQENMNDFW